MGIIRRYKSQMHGNYWRAVLRYGFYSGLILSFVVLVRYWLIYPLSQPLTYVENIALILLMFIFLWRYRLRLTDKLISFKEGYIVCFGLGVVASVIYGIFIYVYAWKIDSGMQQRCYDVQRVLENNVNLTDEQVRFMTTPSSIAFSAIILSVVVSIIMAMVVALLLRTEKSEVIKKK
ncbi:MAG: DUF4199 domain-containing protein [Bacteroidales bacterium]|jgi:glucan phosphoethanolaminetransferase (alkaline phosphatase superfamily)|nr:DUF4199 domain-containing protein [Bacteroidales bacterium]